MEGTKNHSIAVSVIVPIYNVEKYLERCVNSLLAQTYKNLTIILVDDGSPDNCPKMCDSMATEYDNVVALHKKNGGLGSARNYGVSYSNDEWIAFVDSDDYVEPIYIETLVNLRKQYNADMVITQVMRENEDGTGKPRRKEFEPFLANKAETIFKVYGGIDVGWSACGKLIPRSLLLKYPFPDGYYEDCACMYKIINEADKIVIGNYRENYHYIQRKNSILNSKISEKHLHIFDISDDFKVFIDKNYPEMDIVIVLFYKRIVAQLLNMQVMSWDQYKNIFIKYRSVFRKNLRRVIVDKNIPKRLKIYMVLLCSRPELFYFQRKIIVRLRSI